MGEQKTAIILMLILSIILSIPSVVSATTDSWITKESMQQARSGLGVAVVNDNIYAIGGVPSNGFQPSSPGSAVYAGKTSVMVTGTNEEYNPETKSWTFKTSMPTPRAVFAIAVYQNKIYCIGGKTSDNYTGVNEVYDPATDTWETKTSMPTARAFLQANVVNDKIYLIGGHGLPDEFLLINEVYDPLTDTWSTSEPVLSTTFFGYASVVFDNKIYTVGMQIMGGFSEAKTQIFDTETSGWSYGTSPPSIGTARKFIPAEIALFIISAKSEISLKLTLSCRNSVNRGRQIMQPHIFVSSVLLGLSTISITWLF